MNLPDGDRYSRTREWCESRLAVLFGGREAELILGGDKNVTNGATGDIQMATSLARTMVMEWGMSEKLGRVRYGTNDQEVFLGHSVTQSKNISEETARLIDDETRKLIHAGEAKAKRILAKQRNGLHTLAKALIEFETLSGDEVKLILSGKKLKRDDAPKAPTAEPPTPVVPRTQPRRPVSLEPQTQS